MKKRFSILLAIFAAVLVGGVTSISKAETPKQLRFGLLPAEDALEMVKQFQGIAEAVYIPRQFFGSCEQQHTRRIGWNGEGQP